MKIYLIGIKGVGMTALAQIYKSQGYEVLGSDVKEKFFTDQVLCEKKIKVKEGFGKDNVPLDVNFVVVSDAFLLTANQEVDFAKDKGLKILSYSQALGELSKNFLSFGVAGTHGKTTTTAMTGYLLERLGMDPYVLVGSMVPQFGGNARISNTQSRFFVAECDEYRDHFLNFDPSGGIALLNVEYDHPDYFANQSIYRQSFEKFCQKVPNDGFVVYNLDDEIVRKIVTNSSGGARKISFSRKDSQADLFLDAESFLFVEGQKVGILDITLPGKHNLMNALASLGMVYGLDLDLKKALEYLKDFQGTKRRMELKGQVGNVLVFDDYAHHPTEIKASLLALKEKFVAYELVCIFQPHTFSRTEKLLDDFAGAFDQADKLLLLPIYASAREKNGHITSKVLQKHIEEKTKKLKSVEILKDFREVQEFLTKYLELNKKSVLVTMGAGDVWKVGENFLDNK